MGERDQDQFVKAYRREATTDKSTTNVLPKPHLLLGDRPRVSIPLAPGAAGLLQTWLVIDLPSPAAAERPEGRFCADPRLPESEIVLRWGTMPAVPRPLSLLTVSVGEQSGNLARDLRNRERRLHQPDLDRLRGWS
jgi:hypothetical protein